MPLRRQCPPSALALILIAALGAGPDIPTARGGNILVGASPGDFSLKRAAASDPGSGFDPLVAGVNPWSLTVDPHGRHLYWSDVTAGTIRRVAIDGATAGVIETIIDEPGLIPRGLAFDPSRDRLYWLDSRDDRLHATDPDSLETTILAHGFIRPCDSALDPDTGRLFISDSGHDAIFVFDPGTGELEPWLAGDETVGVWGLAFDPRTRRLFFSSHDLGSVHRVRVGGASVPGPVVVVAAGLAGPRGLAFDRSRRFLHIVESATGGVSIVDTRDGSVSPGVYETLLNGRSVRVLAMTDLDEDYLDDPWEVTHFGGTAAASGDENRDGDPRTEREEFFFGSDPNVADGDPFSEWGQVQDPENPGAWTFEALFTRRRDAGLALAFSRSRTLEGWTPLGAGAVRETATPIDDALDSVRIRIELEARGTGPSDPALFLLPAVQAEEWAP